MYGCAWNELGSSPFKLVNLARGGTVIREIVGQAIEARSMGARTVVVEAGANDLLIDHAPISRIEFDFTILMQALDPIPRKIVTLVPVTSREGSNKLHIAANAAIRRISEMHGAEVIDINTAVSEGGLLKPNMTTDGVHFSLDACKVWNEAIKRQLNANAALNAKE